MYGVNRVFISRLSRAHVAMVEEVMKEAMTSTSSGMCSTLFAALRSNWDEVARLV